MNPMLPLKPLLVMPPVDAAPNRLALESLAKKDSVFDSRFRIGYAAVSLGVHTFGIGDDLVYVVSVFDEVGDAHRVVRRTADQTEDVESDRMSRGFQVYVAARANVLRWTDVEDVYASLSQHQELPNRFRALVVPKYGPFMKNADAVGSEIIVLPTWRTIEAELLGLGLGERSTLWVGRDFEQSFVSVCGTADRGYAIQVFAANESRIAGGTGEGEDYVELLCGGQETYIPRRCIFNGNQKRNVVRSILETGRAPDLVSWTRT